MGGGWEYLIHLRLCIMRPTVTTTYVLRQIDMISLQPRYLVIYDTHHIHEFLQLTRLSRSTAPGIFAPRPQDPASSPPDHRVNHPPLPPVKLTFLKIPPAFRQRESFVSFD